MSSYFANTSGRQIIPWATVELNALSASHFTLPEEQFVQPASHGARRTVPSLTFLVQHYDSLNNRTTHILFDLGLRRDISRYSEPIQRHIATRQPLTTEPDVVKSLRAAGLSPDDINFVIYSHVSDTSSICIIYKLDRIIYSC